MNRRLDKEDIQTVLKNTQYHTPLGNYELIQNLDITVHLLELLNPKKMTMPFTAR